MSPSADIVVPVAKSILVRIDSDHTKELELVVTGVIFGFLGRFAQVEIDVAGIVPRVEPAVFWLTATYENRAVAR